MDPLGSIIGWSAAYGAAGLFLIAMVERAVPVIPSYGLLVAIGISAGEGAWSIPVALLNLVWRGLLHCRKAAPNIPTLSVVGEE
ncbi:hypothetical protein [Mesorhizobium escarrei]|uniref:hypothetical protein n=1 Tax=Mesorhizobium escarrei TaxID=666018 RepID=UPI0020A79C25|nr:hypothetical protein [Mesorhizobium escarrei]